MRKLLAVMVLGAGIGVLAQDAGLTLFDEIENTDERSALRRVWTAAEPALQQRLAADFVATFPASVALRDAYELGARASLAAGEPQRALELAGQSLRLLPENPLLLVMTADIAAKSKRLELAESSAREALRHLAAADTPASVAQDAWPGVRARLQASAYLALGLVAAHRNQPAEARRSLLLSLTLHAGNDETLYALGVVEQALDRQAEAAAAFAEATRLSGPMKEAATRSLRELFDKQNQSVTFESYIASLAWTPPRAPERAPSPAAGDYAGSSACRDCHRRIYDSWQSTGMARMFRAYRPDDVFGDFSGANTIQDAARALIADGRHVFDIREGDSGRWTRYAVDYVIGSKWQQAYATRLSDSRIVVFPVQYSRVKQSWLNYWRIVDGPNSPRTDIARFHEVPSEGVYDTSCAPCHTSQLRTRPKVAFHEGGVNCEMCHGPSRDHIARVKSGQTSPTILSTPLNFARMPAQQYVAVCAQCHAQTAIHAAQADGTVNYSDRVPFYRVYPSHLPSNFSRKAFYGDGRHRATTFISESFARSACFRTGNATCGSCHDPHPPDAEANPTSLKFRNDQDQMCLQCHSTLRQRVEQHTRHASNTEASRCVSCHMPKIMDALLFPARTHEIDDLPDAEMTARFGQERSPNACLMCHRDKNVEWLRGELQRFHSAATAQRRKDGNQ